LQCFPRLSIPSFPIGTMNTIIGDGCARSGTMKRPPVAPRTRRTIHLDSSQQK